MSQLYWDTENDLQAGDDYWWNGGKAPIYDSHGRMISQLNGKPSSLFTFPNNTTISTPQTSKVTAAPVPVTPSAPQPASPNTLLSGSNIDRYYAPSSNAVAASISTPTKDLSWTDRISSFFGGYVPQYSSVAEWWNASHPNLPFSSLDADQALKAEQQFNLYNMLGQSNAYSWFRPLSSVAQIAGKGLESILAWNAANEAEKQADRIWKANTTNFNNSVIALRNTWRDRNDSRNAFSGTKKVYYNPDDLKTIG